MYMAKLIFPSSLVGGGVLPTESCVCADDAMPKVEKAADVKWALISGPASVARHFAGSKSIKPFTWWNDVGVVERWLDPHDPIKWGLHLSARSEKVMTDVREVRDGERSDHLRDKIIILSLSSPNIWICCNTRGCHSRRSTIKRLAKLAAKRSYIGDANTTLRIAGVMDPLS